MSQPGYRHALLTPIQIACQTKLTREGVRSMERLSGPGDGRGRRNKPTGYDRKAGERLRARISDFDALMERLPLDLRRGFRRPGSMQRP